MAAVSFRKQREDSKEQRKKPAVPFKKPRTTTSLTKQSSPAEHHHRSDDSKKEGGRGLSGHRVKRPRVEESFAEGLSISQRRKEVKRQKLKHRKPEADFVAQCNRIYSTLIDNREVASDSKVVQDKVQQCIDFVYNFDTPKAEAFAGKARLLCVSRILRMCCKLGSSAQRLQIHTLLEGDFLDLAVTDSGHHLCRKLLKYSPNDETRERLLEKILIQSKLDFLYSKYGSKVVAGACDLYDPTSHKARRIFSTLVTRLCIPESVIRELRVSAGATDAAAAPVSSMDARSIYEGLKDDERRKTQVKEYAVRRATLACDKGLLHETYFHCAVLQLCTWLNATEREELLHALEPGLNELMASPPGVKALCMLLDEADAKARKKFVGKWKEVGLGVGEVAINPVSCTVLLKLLHCIDDTRLSREALLLPLFGLKGAKKVEALSPEEAAKASEQLVILSKDKNARRILLSLLSHGAKTFFLTHKEYESVTKQSNKSKKEAETRYKELLEPLLIPIMRQVLSDTNTDSLKDDWMCDRNARDALVEFLRESQDKSVTERVAQTLESHFDEIADHQTGQRTVVSLLRIGAPSAAASHQQQVDEKDHGGATSHQQGANATDLLRDEEGKTLHERLLTLLQSDATLLAKTIETRGVFILTDLISTAHKMQLVAPKILEQSIKSIDKMLLTGKGKALKGVGIDLLKNRIKSLH